MLTAGAMLVLDAVQASSVIASDIQGSLIRLVLERIRILSALASTPLVLAFYWLHPLGLIVSGLKEKTRMPKPLKARNLVFKAQASPRESAPQGANTSAVCM